MRAINGITGCLKLAFKQFQVNVPFLYTLWKCQKISVFRGYRKGTLTWNAMAYFMPAFHFYTPWNITLRVKCSNTEFLLVRISPYSVRIRENKDQKKTPYFNTFHTVSKNQSFPTFLGGTEIEHWFFLDNNSVFVKITDRNIPGKLLIFCCVNLRILHQTWLNLISRTFC